LIACSARTTVWVLPIMLVCVHGLTEGSTPDTGRLTSLLRIRIRKGRFAAAEGLNLTSFINLHTTHIESTWIESNLHTQQHNTAGSNTQNHNHAPQHRPHHRRAQRISRSKLHHRHRPPPRRQPPQQRTFPFRPHSFLN
jgi:hypothetical protein